MNTEFGQRIHAWREAEDSARKLDMALTMAIARGDRATATALAERLGVQRKSAHDRLSIVMKGMGPVTAPDAGDHLREQDGNQA